MERAILKRNVYNEIYSGNGQSMVSVHVVNLFKSPELYIERKTLASHSSFHLLHYFHFFVINKYQVFYTPYDETLITMVTVLRTLC